MSSPTFDEIYRVNGWGGVESRSGPGSGRQATHQLSIALLGLVGRLGIHSVLDVGCGDGFWMPDLPGYIGLDVSQEALNLARLNRPRRDYRLDTGLAYPKCDLAVVRQVMQHLSYADGLELLERVFASGAMWLLATTYLMGENVDIPTGAGYFLDLRRPPFSLSEPLQVIPDEGGNYPGKQCVLGLWRCH